METEIKLREKLKRIQKEYEKKQRKLKKHNRALKAKEHVKKKLREQASMYSLENAVDCGAGCKNSAQQNSLNNNTSSLGSDLMENSASSHSSKNKLVVGNEAVKEAVADELNESTRTSMPIKDVIQHADVQNTSQRLETEVPRKTSEKLKTNDTINASQNSCSQDIFCSPKSSGRNLFEDIQMTVLSMNVFNLESDNVPVIHSEPKIKGTSVDAIHLTAIQTSKNEKENARPTQHHTGLDNDRRLSLSSSSTNSDQSSVDTSDTPSSLKMSKKFRKQDNLQFCETNSKDGLIKTKKDPLYSNTEQPDCVKELHLDPARSVRTGERTIESKCERPFSKNTGKETSRSLSMNFKWTQGVNIKSVLVNKKSDSADSVLAVSETPTDSDWTLPSSFEDFINVKSRSRKRKSKANTKRRKSLRIAELSSQESSQSVNNSVSAMFDPPQACQSQKMKLSNKKLVISSIFQCLLDEAKRETISKDFCLPPEIITALDKGKSESGGQIQTDFIDACTFSNTTSGTDGKLDIKNNNIEVSTSNTCDPSKLTNCELSGIAEARGQTDLTTQMVSENVQIDNNCPFKEANCDQILKGGFSENACYDDTDNHMCLHSETKVSKNRTQYDSKKTSLKSAISCSPCDEPSTSQTSQDSCLSPPLFDSQTDTSVSQCKVAEVSARQCVSPETSEKAVKVGCRASPAGTAVLPEDEAVCNKWGGAVIEQKAIIQVPKTEQLISVIVGDSSGRLHIVCLCSITLKFYQLENNKWSCYSSEKLGFTVKKNSGCGISWVPDSSTVCVLLQQRRTNSVKLMLYVDSGVGFKIVHVDCLWSRRVLVCAIGEGEFIASHMSEQKNYVTKYFPSQNEVSRRNFDPVSDQVTSLSTAKAIPEVILGLSDRGQLYIWNHVQMSLLATVDISDVSPPDPVCSQAFSEEGFLFLAVFSRKRSNQAGSVLVVNPQMGTCETLTALQTKTAKWTGCSNCSVFQDEYVIVRENCGTVLMWDIYTGELVKSFQEISASCTAATVSGLAIGHKHCIHLYQTVSASSEMENILSQT